MKIKPIGDKVLIKIAGAEETSKGGIIIPQTAQEKTQEGIVQAIGDDKEIKVKVNDRILYDKYAGTSINIDNEELLILKAEDIIAIIE